MRRITLFSFILTLYLITAVRCHAQVVSWLSPYAFGTYGITADPFGNAFTLGQYIGTIDINGSIYTSAGLQDIIIVKYDGAGNVLWATSVGGVNSDWAGNIVYDGVGNVWITGQYTGAFTAGTFNLTSNGGEDVYLVKLDAANGNVLFATGGGGSANDDDGNSIGTDGMGNVYVFGDCASSNFSWGAFSMAASGSLDAFIMKFDNSGTPLWLSKCTGSSWEYTYSGTVDAAGNAYLGGQTFSGTLNINGSPISVGSNNHFITKLDASGNHVWTTLYEGGGNIYSVAADNVGSVYFTTAAGPGTYGPYVITATSGGADVLIGKLNNTGTWSWVNTYGGTGYDEGLGLSCDDIGNVYCVGRFEASMTMGGFNLISNSQTKGFFTKLDTAGNVIWALNSRGGTGSHFVYGVHAAPSDDVYFSGFGSDFIVLANDSSGLDLGFAARIADNANMIKGIVYSDVSNDGTQDAGEQGLANIMIQLDASNYVVASNHTGEYNMYCLSGSHSVSIPNIPLYHTLTTPSAQTAMFPGMGDCDSLNHFGLYPVPNQNDLSIDITPISSPKAGHVLGYLLTYKNVGTTVQLPVVGISTDASLSFVMASPSPTVSSHPTYTWNIGALNPLDMGHIFIYFDIPVTATIGDLINSSVAITPVAIDVTPANNSGTSVSTVVGPYDPNYKTVNIDTLYSISGASYLEYVIHFQNIGTALATNVLITDTLSSFLEMGSLEIVAQSHNPMTLTIDNGNIAKFLFAGINLPDSTSDPLGSMGLVKFRIKQDGFLPVGDKIENFADIYFDYNTPIRTNTASTVHGVALKVDDFVPMSVSIYPNPVSNVLFINAGNENILNVVITDMAGKVVTKLSNCNVNQLEIQVSELAAGSYFVKVDLKNKQQVIKIQKL